MFTLACMHVYMFICVSIHTCETRQQKARANKRRQEKAREGKSRQEETRRGKARQAKRKVEKAREDERSQEKTREGKGKQEKTRKDEIRGRERERHTACLACLTYLTFFYTLDHVSKLWNYIALPVPR